MPQCVSKNKCEGLKEDGTGNTTKDYAEGHGGLCAKCVAAKEKAAKEKAAKEKAAKEKAAAEAKKALAVNTDPVVVKKEYKEKPCEICNQLYTPTGSRQKWCTDCK